MTTRTFDPHQFAIDAGWDFSQIEATAGEGVSDADFAMLRAIATYDLGLEGDKAEAWAYEAEDDLLVYCAVRVAEAGQR